MPTIVNIWNGALAPNGSYINADSISLALYFGPMNVLADQDINVLENVNFSTSILGQTTGNLKLTAPTINLNYDMTTGTGGLDLHATTVNLTGDLFNFSTSSQLMDGSLLTGTATTVNVLGTNTELQQAIDITSSSSGLSTINAASGHASSLIFDYDTNMILSGGLLSGNVAMNNLGAGLELHGYAFELDAGTGFLPFGSGAVSASSGQLRGFLDSGDAFTFAFTQSTPGQIDTFDSAPLASVPIPSAVWLLVSGMLGLMAAAKRRPTIAASTP